MSIIPLHIFDWSTVTALKHTKLRLESVTSSWQHYIVRDQDKASYGSENSSHFRRVPARLENTGSGWGVMFARNSYLHLLTNRTYFLQPLNKVTFVIKSVTIHLWPRGECYISTQTQRKMWHKKKQAKRAGQRTRTALSAANTVVNRTFFSAASAFCSSSAFSTWIRPSTKLSTYSSSRSKAIERVVDFSCSPRIILPVVCLFPASTLKKQYNNLYQDSTTYWRRLYLTVNMILRTCLSDGKINRFIHHPTGLCISDLTLNQNAYWCLGCAQAPFFFGKACN